MSSLSVGATDPMRIPASTIGRPQRAGWLLASLFALLVGIYALWLMALWPGILGEDSAAIMLEVDRAGEFRSGKPAFWFFFINTFYGSTGLAEVPIAIQLAIAALVFARILAWCWQQRHIRTFWFLLLFIALSPRAIYSASTLYPDGPFAIASVSLLFELWLTLRTRRLSTASFGMIAVTLPFALFARANGINAQDGAGLLKLIAQRTPEQQARLLEVAYEGEYWKPTCASCGVKMTERTSGKDGNRFWGCVNYPRCKRTLARKVV